VLSNTVVFNVTTTKRLNEDVTLQEVWDTIQGKNLTDHTEYVVYLAPGIHNASELNVAPLTRLNVSIHHMAQSAKELTVLHVNVTVANLHDTVTMKGSKIIVAECDLFSLRQVHLAGKT
jgi:hypothetical protein